MSAGLQANRSFFQRRIQLLKDLSHTFFIGGTSFLISLYLGTGILISSAAILGVSTLSERILLRLRRKSHFNEHAEKFLERLKAISGYQDNKPNNKKLIKLVKSIRKNVYNPYTTVIHLKKANQILNIIEQYIQTHSKKYFGEAQRAKRQKIFSELIKGGHFVIEQQDQFHETYQQAFKEAESRSSSHYKSQKRARVERDIAQLFKMIHEQDGSCLFDSPEKERLLEYFDTQALVLLKQSAHSKEAKEKLSQRLLDKKQKCLKSLAFADGYTGIPSIDTDASISAGLIFREFLFGVVHVDEAGQSQKILWAQLEGNSHHRDPSVEGPLGRLVNSLLGFIALAIPILNYNLNRLYHHIDFVFYWLNGKTRNIGQYGTSHWTEKKYVQSLLQSNSCMNEMPQQKTYLLNVGRTEVKQTMTLEEQKSQLKLKSSM